MEGDLVPIGDASEILGVSINTLRRWDESGKFRAVRKSPGGDRFYRRTDLDFFPNNMFQAAFKWASSFPEALPAIPSKAYCDDRAVFQTKLSDFQNQLMKQGEFEDIFPLVVAVAGEIGGNSFDHNLGNWPDIHGIFFAYDLQRREVVLADRGVGVLATLKKAVPGLHSDEAALQTAFTEVISGRTHESRGNGLKFVREVVSDSLINLRYQSGDAELEISRDESQLSIRPAVRQLRGCIAYIKF